MTADTLPLLGLALGVVVLAGVALARRTGLPDPIVLVLAGLAASFLPGAPAVDLPPQIVFLVFLPPLLYRSSFLTSPRSLWENKTPLALLAIGLVVATALVVALVVSRLVPGVPFAAALVLGAVVAPTDPVAAAGVFGRLGAPRRLVELVEGESLVNDASALVLYSLAVEAVVSGPPTVLAAVGTLVLAVAGGTGIGVALALAIGALRSRVHDVGLQLLLSLLTPYLGYVLADQVHASGVLAVVTTGVVLGTREGGLFGPEVRLQSNAFWSLLELVLNAVLFVLLGLEVRHVLDTAPGLGPAGLAVDAAAVVGTVVVLRVAWQFVVPPGVYRLRRRFGVHAAPTPAAQRLVLGWTGMRGAISLAAALAIPLEADGQPFPGRPVLIFLTVCVVLATLVLQGLTLPLLLAALGLAGEGHRDSGAAEGEARVALADVALARLTELEEAGDVPPASMAPLRQMWEHARTQASPEPNPDDQLDLTGIRLEVARAQAVELERLTREGSVPPEVARGLREEIDLQRVRLSRR